MINLKIWYVTRSASDLLEYRSSVPCTFRLLICGGFEIVQQIKFEIVYETFGNLIYDSVLVRIVEFACFAWSLHRIDRATEDHSRWRCDSRTSRGSGKIRVYCL